MKRLWLVVGLCCGILWFGGCNHTEKPDNSKVTSETNKEEENLEDNAKVKPGTGEGTSLPELQDLSDSQEYQINEVIPVPSDEKKYELKIDSVSYMKDEEGKDSILLIDYTYHNLSDELLMVGDVRFQLTDGNQEKVYTPYYFSEQIVAEPVEKGYNKSAQVAFEDVDENSGLYLVYTDISLENEKPILIKIDEVK
ncbi:MAG: hypothetical protein ACI4EH_10810 [Oliverpabstia sp.]